ncbi:hypothetical protein BESB_058300 [Besnoitia besnoiti]|uniref:CRAL-TRIO domain-containing protein n=1 Tax=Besnoitia besnoiti TaxID=94643 RepID=A0A2A9MH05_BESBE|nr:hypothetical protein BESB_058300 [Besnoitia besnoiti]PFH34943.1 hypothetical protein BESB_058300 [Besnoitia besnoiti]
MELGSSFLLEDSLSSYVFPWLVTASSSLQTMALPRHFLFSSAAWLCESVPSRELKIAPTGRPTRQWKAPGSCYLFWGVAVFVAVALSASPDDWCAGTSLFPAFACAEAAGAEGPQEASGENDPSQGGGEGRNKQGKPPGESSSSSSRTSWSPKRPQPLPEERVLPALRLFESVHGQMTLFFKGFSRQGSLIAYDLLDELRTVDEARMMMDVEFLVLDRLMEHYDSTRHLRVVDTSIIHKMLNLGNLLPWRIPRVLTDIKKMVLEYKPVLTQFLNRYEKLIEVLILTNVPRALSPFRGLIAALIGVPRQKLVFASSLADLEAYIPRHHIPREFWNPTGGPVREGKENTVSWRIMLEEVKAKLGSDAVTPAGHELLRKIKEEEASGEQTAAGAGAPDAQASSSQGPSKGQEIEEFLLFSGDVNVNADGAKPADTTPAPRNTPLSPEFPSLFDELGSIGADDFDDLD